MSRSTNLSLRPSSDWRRTKLFDAPQSTRARSDKSFVASNFKVMSETSSPGAETHNDCVSGATFVKRFANSLEVAGSVGRSAPTDPVHFLMVRLAVAASQQRWTHAHCPSWRMVVHFAQYCSVLGVEHYTRMRSALTSDSDCTFAIACCLKSEVSRSQHSRGPLVLDLRSLVVSVDDKSWS